MNHIQDIDVYIHINCIYIYQLDKHLEGASLSYWTCLLRSQLIMTRRRWLVLENIYSQKKQNQARVSYTYDLDTTFETLRSEHLNVSCCLSDAYVMWCHIRIRYCGYLLLHSGIPLCSRPGLFCSNSYYCFHQQLVAHSNGVLRFLSSLEPTVVE